MFTKKPNHEKHKHRAKSHINIFVKTEVKQEIKQDKEPDCGCISALIKLLKR